MSSPNPPRTTPANLANAEKNAIVARLEDFLCEQIEEGRRLGIKVSAPEVFAVIENAILRMKSAGEMFPLEQSARAYFLDGMAESLALEQQGVFEKVKDAEGQETFVPVGDPLWIECLLALKQAIAIRIQQP